MVPLHFSKHCTRLGMGEGRKDPSLHFLNASIRLQGRQVIVRNPQPSHSSMWHKGINLGHLHRIHWWICLDLAVPRLFATGMAKREHFWHYLDLNNSSCRENKRYDFWSCGKINTIALQITLWDELKRLNRGAEFRDSFQSCDSTNIFLASPL